jgi:branched-chain amino acid transport system ATP-binding protein
MTLLQVTGVSKTFHRLRALDNISLTIEPGLVFGLIGPNGAGKTTLVNLISGYLLPDAGSINLDGHPIAGMAPHRLAALGIARTYQNLRLFEEATVIENILIGRHRIFRRQPWYLRVRRAAEREQRAVALRLAERLGLGHLAEATVDAQPYGTRRRVEIARALATQPRLLLLDEPTAGLTRSESDEVGAVIRDINQQGITVVLVDHNVRLVSAVCDVVAVVDWGRVIAQDTPSAVWQDPRVRSAYLGAGRHDQAGEG